MQVDLTFRPRGAKSNPRPQPQPEDRFGRDTLDLGAGNLTSQADGPVRCLDGGATDISSKGDGSFRCIDGGATDISSGLEMGYGCQNGDTSITSGWKITDF